MKFSRRNSKQPIKSCFNPAVAAAAVVVEQITMHQLIKTNIAFPEVQNKKLVKVTGGSGSGRHLGKKMMPSMEKEANLTLIKISTFRQKQQVHQKRIFSSLLLLLATSSLHLYLAGCAYGGPVLEQAAMLDAQKIQVGPLVELESDNIRTEAEAAAAAAANERAENEETPSEALLMLLLSEYNTHEQTTSLNSPSLIRRLKKRSGISDQILAEMQIMRALRKQLERASKIAASNLNSAPQTNEGTS